MPILANAKKALRVSKKKAAMNQPIRSRVKTMTDNFLAHPGVESLSQAFSALDRAVKKHLMHRNKAARLKSQMSKKLAAKKGDTSPVAKPQNQKSTKKSVKAAAAKSSAKKVAAKKVTVKKTAAKKADKSAASKKK